MVQENNKVSGKKQSQKFDVDIDPEDPLYVISVVSHMVGIPIWTLRKLDEMGVVKPKRLGKKTRCYSQVQIKKLSYVHYLMESKHVNISAVKYVLEMEYEV
jgi:DNA-binding transcriptional MerR regulator